jgi:hypothetical protein
VEYRILLANRFLVGLSQWEKEKEGRFGWSSGAYVCHLPFLRRSVIGWLWAGDELKQCCHVMSSVTVVLVVTMKNTNFVWVVMRQRGEASENQVSIQPKYTVDRKGQEKEDNA